MAGSTPRKAHWPRPSKRDVGHDVWEENHQNHQLLNVIILILTHTWVAQLIAALPPARSEDRSTPHWLPDTS